MVCYDRAVQNSLDDLVQWIYGGDGRDGAFIEKQAIETFGLIDREFGYNYCVDVADPAGGNRKILRLVGGHALEDKFAE